MKSPLDRLKSIGFQHVGCWECSAESLIARLHSFHDSRNVMYAFLVDGDVVYVGKSIRPLARRMSGYEKPGPTQNTNLRNRRALLEALQDCKTAEIYAFVDNGLLQYGGFHVNLAAGLEDALITELRPAWNGASSKPKLVKGDAGKGAHAYDSGEWTRLWLEPKRGLDAWGEVAVYAINFDGYAFAEHRWGNQQGDARIAEMMRLLENGAAPDGSFEELRYCLFMWQRCMRHWSSPDPSEGEHVGLLLYRAVCDAWDREHMAMNHERAINGDAPRSIADEARINHE